MKLFNLFTRKQPRAALDINRTPDGFISASEIPRAYSRDELTKVGAATACIYLLSSTLAGLEWSVWQRTSGNHRRRVEEHPLNNFLNNPARMHDRYSFFEMLFEALFTNGNAYAYIRRLSDGVPFSLLPLRQEDVHQQIEFNKEMVSRPYQVTFVEGGKPYRVPANKVLHLRGQGYDMRSNLSTSPIQHAAGLSVRLAKATAESLSNSIERGYRSPGWISSDLDLGDDQARQWLKELQEKLAGPQNAGGVTVFPRGLTFNQLNIPPIDQYLITVMKWTVEDIARCFGVPLPLIHSSEGRLNANLERHWASFIRTTVNKHVLRIGGQMGLKFLSPEDRVNNELFVMADLQPLHLPILTDAIAAAVSGAQSGVLELDEIRDKILRDLNLEPKPNGLEQPPQTAGAPPREDGGDVDDGVNEEGDDDDTEEDAGGEDDEADR